MKLAWILFAAAIPTLAQQPAFDFKSLEKLGVNAKESTNINLEGDALKAALGLVGGKLGNLTSVYVHSYEFARKGQYNPQDLEQVRAYIRSLNWSKIIDTKEPEETNEIYIKPLPNGKVGGLAVIAAEAKEVTVVFLSGEIDLRDLNKLGGLGVPDLPLGGPPSDAPKKD